MAGVDYDALARQHGGVDYDALAASVSSPPVPTAPPTSTWVDTVVNALPWLAGAAGGVVGGVGGTVAGFGVGGVPGAAAGAAVGGAGGEALKQNINTLRGKPMASPMAAAAQIGRQAAIQGGSELAGQGLAKGVSLAAPILMQSAVKPAPAMLKDARTTAPKLVQTLLDEGINVTEHGLSKLETLLGATNDVISDLVKNAPGKVLPGDVAQRTVRVADRAMMQVNPTSDVQAVKDVATEFLNHPRFSSPTTPAAQALGAPARAARPLSVAEAQTMKQGTYQKLAGSYGELSSATKEAQKALARGLKEEIAREVPEISALNAREGDLIAGLEAVGRRVALSGNKDPIGFAWVAHRPMTFLTALMDRSPAVKSMLARGLYVPAGKVAKVDPQLIRVAVSAVASAQPDAAPPAE